MQSIALIEDSNDIYQLVLKAFGDAFEIRWLKSIHEASYELMRKLPDLVLLDAHLPDGDGFQFCSLLRAMEGLRDVPVIFITAKNTLADKVLGFSVGADDYMTKPFDPRELRARSERRMKRQLLRKVESDIVQFGRIRIDQLRRRASSIQDSCWTDLSLTATEFRLLSFFASNSGRTLSRDEILDGVWGEDFYIFSRAVDTHVSKLRQKLGEYSDYIQSVRGLGYKCSPGPKPENIFALRDSTTNFSREPFPTSANFNA